MFNACIAYYENAYFDYLLLHEYVNICYLLNIGLLLILVRYFKRNYWRKKYNHWRINLILYMYILLYLYVWN